MFSSKDGLDDLTSFSQDDVMEKVVQNVLDGLNLPGDVFVTPSIWDDSEIKPWIHRSLQTQCGKHIAWHILQHPTANPTLLHQRQCALKYFDKQGAATPIASILSQFKAIEADVQWLMTRPCIRNDNTDSPTLQLLYPSFFAFRFINRIPSLLAALHIYKGYIAPYTNIITPLSTIFAPYMYLRKLMGTSLDIKTYLKLVATLFSKWTKPTGNLRTDATRLGTLGIYLGMFVVGFVQSLELASTVRRVRRVILQKSKSIREFVATNFLQIQEIPGEVWRAFGIQEDEQEFSCIANLPSGASFVYKYLTDSAMQRAFQSLLRRVYVLDTVHAFRQILARKEACYATFLPSTPSTLHTKMYAMGHIQLPPRQVRNPCSLQKNLILTGPNAGGKTTYVKSICSNYLLAQTFGITVAQHALIQLQHAFGSFMRILDHVGDKSLFEAEVARCAEIVQHAQQISARGQSATYFLDEPMHSTPPAEGASASIATVEFLGQLPGIRVITTTHFFELTQLEKEHPDAFQNISMEAMPTSAGFHFPYRIRKGHSFQCIALELLAGSHIPPELISRAIKWKNKICAVHVNDP
jgi:hypothetical protein